MTIDAIERRTAYIADLKRRLRAEQIAAHLQGTTLEDDRAELLIRNIELHKLINSCDLIDLKWDRWEHFPEVEAVDPAAPCGVRKLQAEMLNLQRKVGALIAGL